MRKVLLFAHLSRTPDSHGRNDRKVVSARVVIFCNKYKCQRTKYQARASVPIHQLRALSIGSRKMGVSSVQTSRSSTATRMAFTCALPDH